MCEKCGSNSSAQGCAPRRRKLWELDGHWRCPVVGTCLSIGDLSRLAAKLKWQLPDGMGDYEMHVTFVKAASEHATPARLMHKLLDRKYQAALRRSSKAASPGELTELWHKARQSGDIPGPLWALVTHPASPTELLNEAFADVHMLSHLVGASNRADIRRLKELEEENLVLRDAIARARTSERKSLAENNAVIREIEHRLREAVEESFRLRAVEHRLQTLESGHELRNLRLLLKELQEDLNLTGLRAEELQKELKSRDQEISELTDHVRRLEEQLRRARDEHEGMEREFRLLQAAQTSMCADAPSEACGDFDLCRQCIVYVGGRTNQTPHLRAVVERHNGTLVHHDGGVDDSHDRLQGLLCHADAVFFPVDCVSHGATNDIKRFCKRNGKPFVALPTSGLSTFVRELRGWAERADVERSGFAAGRSGMA